MKRILPILALAVLGIACGGTPEAGQNGTCILECGSPVVAPTNLTIEPLDPGVQRSIDCNGTEDILQNPQFVRFRAYTRLPGSEGDSADDIIPVGGLGFEPWITGLGELLSFEKTADEFRNDAEATVVPPRFRGVETPSSEWCSDTCGVMTYEFRIQCGQGSGSLSAGIAAGSVKLGEFIDFDVSL